MKITIPFNIFIFIWCLIGVAGFSYTYVQDLSGGINIFATREFYSQLFVFLLCAVYCVQYLKHVNANRSVLHRRNNIRSNNYLITLSILFTSLSGCILLDDTVKVSQHELRRQHFDKYYGNDKDEQLKRSMTREPVFDSIRRVSNPDRSNPRPVDPPGF